MMNVTSILYSVDGEIAQFGAYGIKAKWLMDDATTLSEAVKQLRSYADMLEMLEEQGYQLIWPVSNDEGFIGKDGKWNEELEEA